jgi:hypothetical protein
MYLGLNKALEGARVKQSLITIRSTNFDYPTPHAVKRLRITQPDNVHPYEPSTRPVTGGTMRA